MKLTALAFNRTKSDCPIAPDGNRLWLTAGSVTLAALMSGCAITQTVSPVQRLESRQLCVIENPAVRMDFLEVYQRVLTDAGYLVQKLPSTSSVRDCPVITTYTANWKWDLAMYMAFADIKVFREGQLVGQATYDSRSGGSNMNKFIKADAKIGELVHQLFPGGAGAVATSSAGLASSPSVVDTKQMVPHLRQGTRLTFSESDARSGGSLGESTFVINEVGAQQISFNDDSIVIGLDGRPIRGSLHGNFVYGVGPQEIARGGSWLGKYRASAVHTDVPVQFSLGPRQLKEVSGRTFDAVKINMEGFSTRENVDGLSSTSGAAFKGEMLVDTVSGVVLDIKVTSRNQRYTLQRSLVRISGA